RTSRHLMNRLNGRQAIHGGACLSGQDDVWSPFRPIRRRSHMSAAVRARRVRGVALAVVAAIALVAAAFSQASDAGQTGSKSTTADIVARAKANVLKYAGWPKAWKGPTEPTKPQKVNYVMLLSCSQATACARETAGSAEAAKEIGWKTQVVDGKGDPNVM